MSRVEQEPRVDREMGVAFERATELLDAGLSQARRELPDPPFRIMESSNRSGWERSAPPFYLWQFWIFKDEEWEGRIRRAGVQLHYFEPVVNGISRELKVRIVAEIFRRGALSDVERVDERRIALAELSGPEAVAAVIRDAIAEADAELSGLR